MYLSIVLPALLSISVFILAFVNAEIVKPVRISDQNEMPFGNFGYYTQNKALQQYNVTQNLVNYLLFSPCARAKDIRTEY